MINVVAEQAKTGQNNIIVLKKSEEEHMGIIDNDDWKLCRNEPDDPKQDDSIRLTISNRAITLSPKAKTTLGNPKFVEIWFGKKNGRVLFVGKSTDTGFPAGETKSRKDYKGDKNETIEFRRYRLTADIRARLIRYGNIGKHVGPDNKLLTGASFCVEENEFREQDITGVVFDLSTAYCRKNDRTTAKKGCTTTR